jgi:2,3-bisphosphoglycerate-dependent phosphoglycerate mutase
VSVEVVFETHSLTTDNERGIATGWLDGRLSVTGRRLAEELGRRRADESLAAVYTSDLGRAVETATIAFGTTGLPVLCDARLRECNYGDLNGAPVAAIERERLRHIDEPFPHGESYRQAVARVGAFLDELAIEQGGTRVLLIGHAATRWALDHLLDGEPLEELVRRPFDWQEGWLYTLPSR